MASEPGRAQTLWLARLPPLATAGCARWWGTTAGDPQRQAREGAQQDAKGPDSPTAEGESPVAELAGALCTNDASTAGHEGARGKPGSPLPKAKYLVRPIADEYREGTVKSTPGGE